MPRPRLIMPPTEEIRTNHEDEEEGRVEDDPLGEEPAPLASGFAEKTSLVFPATFLPTPFLSTQLPAIFVDAEVVGIVDVVVVDVVDVGDADVASKALELVRNIGFREHGQESGSSSKPLKNSKRVPTTRPKSLGSKSN